MTRAFAASATVLLAATGGAFAQTEGGGTTMGTARSAAEITCREVVALDTAMVPGVLHFIAGYTEASRLSDGLPPAAAIEDDSTSTETAAAAANTTGRSNMNDTSPEDISGMAGTNAGTDTAAAAAGGPEDTTGATVLVPDIEAVAGYFPIPVEQTIVACNAEPDALAADVIERQRPAGPASDTAQ